MIEEFEKTLPILDKMIGIVFDNEDDLLKDFENVTSFIGLTHVYFSESYLKIVFILDSGQHITDEIPIEEFIEWLKPRIGEE